MQGAWCLKLYEYTVKLRFYLFVEVGHRVAKSNVPDDRCRNREGTVSCSTPELISVWPEAGVNWPSIVVACLCGCVNMTVMYFYFFCYISVNTEGLVVRGLFMPETFHSKNERSVWGTFVPGTFRSWNFHSRPFIPRNFCSQDFSFPGTFAANNDYLWDLLISGSYSSYMFLLYCCLFSENKVTVITHNVCLRYFTVE